MQDDSVTSGSTSEQPKSKSDHIDSGSGASTQSQTSNAQRSEGDVPKTPRNPLSRRNAIPPDSIAPGDRARLSRRDSGSEESSVLVDGSFSLTPTSDSAPPSTGALSQASNLPGAGSDKTTR
jgi:hypothetical protein